MSSTIYQRMEDSVHSRELAEKRQQFATILLTIMLAVYIDFTLLIAFTSGWLGIPLNPNTNVTHGIPVGTGATIISFAFTGTYIWRTSGESDRFSNEILREVQAPWKEFWQCSPPHSLL